MNKQIRTDNGTEAQINHWKNQHGKDQILRLMVPVTDDLIEVGGKEVPAEVAAGYFRIPDLEVLGAVSEIGSKDKHRGLQVMFENCWLGGDERIKKRPQSLASAVNQLSRQFKVLESEVEKL